MYIVCTCPSACVARRGIIAADGREEIYNSFNGLPHEFFSCSKKTAMIMQNDKLLILAPQQQHKRTDTNLQKPSSPLAMCPL